MFLNALCRNILKDFKNAQFRRIVILRPLSAGSKFTYSNTARISSSTYEILNFQFCDVTKKKKKKKTIQKNFKLHKINVALVIFLVRTIFL